MRSRFKRERLQEVVSIRFAESSFASQTKHDKRTEAEASLRRPTKSLVLETLLHRLAGGLYTSTELWICFFCPLGQFQWLHFISAVTADTIFRSLLFKAPSLHLLSQHVASSEVYPLIQPVYPHFYRNGYFSKSRK